VRLRMLRRAALCALPLCCVMATGEVAEKTLTREKKRKETPCFD